MNVHGHEHQQSWTYMGMTVHGNIMSVHRHEHIRTWKVFQIRIHADPYWFGILDQDRCWLQKLDPDPNPNPYWDQYGYETLDMNVHGHERSWSWTFMVMNAHGHESAWSWKCMVMKVHGHESTWSWKYMVMNVHGHKRTWSWEYMVMKVHGHDSTWSWKNMVMQVHGHVHAWQLTACSHSAWSWMYIKIRRKMTNYSKKCNWPNLGKLTPRLALGHHIPKTKFVHTIFFPTCLNVSLDQTRLILFYKYLKK